MDRHHDSQSHRNERKRSRSPTGDERYSKDLKRCRSGSPHRHKHHHSEKSPKAKLPFRSRHLHKHDFESYKALFAEYLDLQKQLYIDQLEQDEAKGRWKSFLGKWNRGELAEGWYDPETKQRADSRYTKPMEKHHVRSTVREPVPKPRASDPASEDDEDGYGPTLPNAEGVRKSGPSVPGFQDLQYKREVADEDHEARTSDLRHDRKQDRRAQKERLEELVPRADPGSRERQLEQKRDATVSNKTFAEAKEAGAEEIGDGDLMGDDGIDNYKAKMRATDKKKNEREIRKEEVLRARAAEREEKMAEHREKEEKTMVMLRQLAQQRFGIGQ